MKNARERMDIVSAYREVGSSRGAAAMCGTTHKTVQRVIAAHQAGQGQGPVRTVRARNYDQVAERVRATQGRISAKRLLPAARTAGFGGSARNFRRLVAEAKQAWRREHSRGRRPGVWSPGEHLLIDWGVQDGLHVFVPFWAGRGSGSSGSPPMRRRRPRSRCWPNASRCWAGSRKWCWPTGWVA